MYERTTQTHIFEFLEKAFNGLQAIWQRLVIAALDTLLLDPERVRPLVRRWQIHARLIHGAWAALRAQDKQRCGDRDLCVI